MSVFETGEIDNSQPYHGGRDVARTRIASYEDCRVSNPVSDQLLNSSVKMAETVRFELTVLFRVTLR